MSGLRAHVQERVARLVARARSGDGGALLVAGEPGSGKTTVLDGAVAAAGDALVLRACGVPIERGLAHAGLHALLSPVADLSRALPEAQSGALQVALGRQVGPPPGPLLLGASVLGLLAAASEERAVLLVVDDVQWLDDASVAALAFAARRLDAERVAVLLAARAAQVPTALHGVDRVDLAPLSPQEAAALLAATEVAPAVAAELVHLTGGNVLVLVEQARRLDPAQRVGLAPLPPVVGRLFVDDVARLAPSALEAAGLCALAEPLPAAVLHAARTRLGSDVGALVAAEQAGLLQVGAEGVRWRHPLARAAVLDAMDPARRRALSAVLAEVAEQLGAPAADVVGLRLAAADGPDERLAQALDGVARQAAAAGDHALAARCRRSAADVGTDVPARGPRLLEAAEALLRGGRLEAARAGYEQALRAGVDAEGQARARLAQGRSEHLAGSPDRAVQRFREAADVAPRSGLRVRACAEAVLAAMYAGLPELALAEAARAAEAHDPQVPAERMLALHAQGAALVLAGDLEAGRPLLQEALEQARTARVLEEQPDLVLWVVTVPLLAGGDPDAGADLARPALDRLRLEGDLLWLPRLMRLWGARHLLAGRAAAAYAAFDEVVQLSRAAGQVTQLVEGLAALAQLEALRGERDPCLAHAAELDQLLAVLEVPFLSGRAWQARGLLHLTLGEATAAASALAPARHVPPGVRFREQVLGDLVEALLLDGRPEEAAEAAALAPGGRGQALVDADDGRGVALLLALAEQAADGSSGVEAARCRLLAGERLRRAGLRRDARVHLRAAADVFARAGAAPWQARAEEGLRASGEVMSRRTAVAEPLTGAEQRVAQLVAEGRPTREVAAMLFLSPKTVESHLSRIYRKLGVRSRAELAAHAPG